ncbi:MAG: phosphate signaling complex protein PhoU [Verrucomicrobiota bacterium]
MSHILGNFEASLLDCREKVLTMASIAQRNLANGMKGLFERNLELCNQAIADDEDVDILEKEIDAEGLQLIMRYQPVAHDLRVVLSTMRISKDLERVSDQACNIGRRARKILKYMELDETKLVEPIYDMATGILTDAVKSLAEGDTELALSLKERDRELDSVERKLAKKLTKRMEESPTNIKPYLHLIFILRSLERIGDHAINISRDTVFIEQAASIRSGDPEELQQELAKASTPSSATS